MSTHAGAGAASSWEYPRVVSISTRPGSTLAAIEDTSLGPEEPLSPDDPEKPLPSCPPEKPEPDGDPDEGGAAEEVGVELLDVHVT